MSLDDLNDNDDMKDSRDKRSDSNTMRSKTPSFIVQVKLHLHDSVKDYLNKSFNIFASAYNETLCFGLKRFSAMKRNQRYQELLKLKRELVEAKIKTAHEKLLIKEINEELGVIQAAYELTKYQLSLWLLSRRSLNESYKRLNSGELQIIAENAYQSLSNVIFYKTTAEKLKFKSKYDSYRSFRNRVNNTGTRLVVSDKPDIAYRLYIHKRSTFIDIPVKSFTDYQQEQLLRADKIKYVQIISKTIRGKQVFYLQIVCQGVPATKIQKGEGVTGIDPGISTVAYVSKDSCRLVDLVPSKFECKERLIQNLSRKIDRSLRSTNPEAYNENGTRKNNVRYKRFSNRVRRLITRQRAAYRKLTEDRRKLQCSLVNYIVSNSSVIKIEDLNIKNLQKRKRVLRINPKTGRPFSNRRYGKSILRAAPGYFMKLLYRRTISAGCKLEIISPKRTKPSQYNHITDEFNKKELTMRVYNLTDEITDVQRDLYSAFLIAHIEDDAYLTEQLIEDFDVFYANMKEELHRLRQKPTRLSWYVK